ncbi:MAG: hypothetical protein PHS80_14350 [Methanothrix sp.]|nr:hypothetical protein [Methanothrix sp.]MDD4448096.1 hypothetical protein [Methanothrix sp.]
MNALAVIPVILLLQASYFDMQGTIVKVISPTSLLIGNNTVILADVDASGLTARQYAYLTGVYKTLPQFHFCIAFSPRVYQFINNTN